MNLSAAQRFRLGLFVLVGLLLLGAALATVIGRRMLTESIPFAVRYRESVSGLDIGSPVRYQGLRVGRVAAMRIADDDPGAIEVDLALDSGTVLYEGTEAQLDSAGLTGLTYINLTPGDPRSKPLEAGSLLPPRGSLTSRITGEAEQIRVRVEKALEQTIRFTSDENRVRLERLLDDADKLLRDTDAAVLALQPQLEKAIADLDAAAIATQKLAHAGERSLRGVDDTLLAARTSLSETNRVLGGIDEGALRATLQSARSAAAKVDARVGEEELGRVVTSLLATADGARKTVAAATRVVESVGLAVRAVREDVAASTRSLRESTEALRSFSRDVARDPSVLLRGREEPSR
ncbi:MAG: hypothetical protein RIT45_3194 [Pseudomonadota bacterium]